VGLNRREIALFLGTAVAIAALLATAVAAAGIVLSGRVATDWELPFIWPKEGDFGAATIDTIGMSLIVVPGNSLMPSSSLFIVVVLLISSGCFFFIIL